MKRIVSFMAMISILLAFTVATSGCGENRNQYFDENNEINKIENKIVAEVKQLYVEKEPEYYSPTIYKNKSELSLYARLDDFSPGTYPDPKVSITWFGWDTITPIFEDKKFAYKKIVADKTKDLFNYELVQLFDKSNSLGYKVEYNDDYETLVCAKLGEDANNESWKIKLPFENGIFCKKTINGNIIFYGEKEILQIDPKTAKIVSTYKLDNPQLEIHMIIPQNNRLWIYTLYKENYHTSYTASTRRIYFGLSHGMYDYKLRYKVYVLNPENGSSFKFKTMINQTKLHNESMVLNNENEIFVVDENLNVRHDKLAELHKNAKFDDIFRFNRFRALESDCVGVIKDKVKYVYDIDNPERLIEIPKDLESINWDYSGSNWDYYFKKDDYMYGYNIYKRETTWKIKIDNEHRHMLPYYSTEYGILSSNWYIYEQKYVVTAFGEKK